MLIINLQNNQITQKILPNQKKILKGPIQLFTNIGQHKETLLRKQMKEVSLLFGGNLWQKRGRS